MDATALSSSERRSDDHHARNDVVTAPPFANEAARVAHVAGDGFCDPGRRRGSDS